MKVPNMPGQSDNEDVQATDSTTGAETGAIDAVPVPVAETDAPAAVAPSNESSPTINDDLRVTDDDRVSDVTSDAPVASSEEPMPGEMPDEAPLVPDADATMSVDADSTADLPTESTTAPQTSAAEGARKFKKGDLIDGVVKATSPTSVIVALDGDSEGVILSAELERMGRQNLEELKLGASVRVFVVNPRDHNGNILLSYNRAVEETDWQRAEEFRQSQEVMESRVAGYNKGGLIVRFGRLRGFVPQSQMSADRRRALEGETEEERWTSMVNEPIMVKVVEVDRQRNRLILSERSASRETREKRKESLIQQLSVGESRVGRVVSLEDFGAFVDIGGAEGLVHLTEMSWQHITHPKDVLKVGQEVRVEVISVDPNAKRIGLSMKRQAPDPWDTIALAYQVGQLVKAEVTKLTKFGAFAQLVDVKEIEGLIHISELSDQRVQHPKEVVKEGDIMTLRVVKVDVQNRRLGLSLKRVNSAEYMDSDWQNFPDA